jgi:hypothetical protein
MMIDSICSARSGGTRTRSQHKHHRQSSSHSSSSASARSSSGETMRGLRRKHVEQSIKLAKEAMIDSDDDGGEPETDYAREINTTQSSLRLCL